MARKRKQWRVLGPYREPHRRRVRWRIIIVNPEGDRESVFAKTENEAEKVLKEAWVEIAGATCFDKAIDRYDEHLTWKGNKQSSVNTTTGRLRRWLPSNDPVFSYTRRMGERQYARRCNDVRAATHRAELAEIKTFFRWMVARKMIKESPVEGIEPRGRSSRGKPQLHTGEAIKFSDTAIKWYRSRRRGWEAALGNLICLWLGPRSGEVCSLKVCDVDVHPGGVDLWAAEQGGKTEAAKRRFPVEGDLVELLELQVQGKPSDGWLFPAKSRTGHRTATWLRKAARRICDEAEVPYSPPHGLRGTQSSIAVEAGATSQLVAQQLGQSSARVAEMHYIRPEVQAEQKVRRGLKVLAGGRQK